MPRKARRSRTQGRSRMPIRRAPEDADIRSFAAASAGCGAEGFVIRKDTHLLVGDLPGVARADRALRIAAHLELGEARGQRVVEEQAADQRLAAAHDQL